MLARKATSKASPTKGTAPTTVSINVLPTIRQSVNFGTPSLRASQMKNLRLLQRHLEKQGYATAAPAAGKAPIIQGDYRRVA